MQEIKRELSRIINEFGRMVVTYTYGYEVCTVFGFLFSPDEKEIILLIVTKPDEETYLEVYVRRQWGVTVHHFVKLNVKELKLLLHTLKMIYKT